MPAVRFCGRYCTRCRLKNSQPDLLQEISLRRLGCLAAAARAEAAVYSFSSSGLSAASSVRAECRRLVGSPSRLSRSPERMMLSLPVQSRL